jgi:uncharacterized Zn finger protein (UPF0148 family)
MEYPVRVTCPECGYAQVVREDDDRVPADCILEHGRETGHKLNLESVADRADADPPSGIG